MIINSCWFFEDGEPVVEEKTVSSIKIKKSSLELKVNALEYLSFTYSPSDAKFEPSVVYNKDLIDVQFNNNGFIIKGLKEGKTSLTISCGSVSDTCIVTVAGTEVIPDEKQYVVEPYIYSNTNILKLEPNDSEKVCVSLYGGSAADVNDYVWTSEDASICKVNPAGQYCVISTLAAGYTRIKVTHKKASYPYYIGVYVFEDPGKATYITTQDNILTMYQGGGEKTVSVNLINPPETAQDTTFTWEIVDSTKYNATNVCPVSIAANGAKAVITPVKTGSCTVRIKHKDCSYPLDILCRVITVVNNVYIQPDKSVITLNGNNIEILTSSLVNVSPADYSMSDYKYSVANPQVAKIVSEAENKVSIMGLTNGSTKLTVSHKNAAYSREILLISTNQIADAVDASCYITTSNNYVRTKVGNQPVKVSISLRGGIEGDETDFLWGIQSSASDESSDPVIKVETTTGTVFNGTTPPASVSTSSRSAAFSYADGSAYITPLKEGSAVITLTHKKVLYPTQILVKVLNKNAVITEPLYFKGDGIVRLLNGQSTQYSVILNGKNLLESDRQNISWKAEDERLKIVGNEDKVQITAPAHGTGSVISKLIVSHPKVEVPKTVVIMTADDEVTLAQLKAFYTDKNYYNMKVGESVNFGVNTIGFQDDADWSLLEWTVEKPGYIDFDISPLDKRYIKVTGLKVGTTKLTASMNNCSCTFIITIFPLSNVSTDSSSQDGSSGSQGGGTSQGGGGSGSQNGGTSQGGGSGSQSGGTSQGGGSGSQSGDTSQGEGSGSQSGGTSQGGGSGSQGGGTSQGGSSGSQSGGTSQGGSSGSQSGSTSQGDIYDYEREIYFTTAQNVIVFNELNTAKTVRISAVNMNQSNYSGIQWVCSDASVCNVIPNGDSATVTAIKNGEAVITVDHPLSQNKLKIYVKIGSEYIIKPSKDVYISSSSDVITLLKDSASEKIHAVLVNYDGKDSEHFQFSISNENIACFEGRSENGFAYIKPKSSGQTELTITNPLSSLSKKVLIVVGNSSDELASLKYLTTSNNVVTIGEGKSRTVSVSVRNSTDVVLDGYTWTSSDLSVVDVITTDGGPTVSLQANKQGTATITVRNTACPHPLQMIVHVVDPIAATKHPYIQLSTNVAVVSTDSGYKDITVDLVGGTKEDFANFVWESNDSSICTVFGQNETGKIKAEKEGRTYITVSHPKADYPAQLLVLCEAKKQSDCYISVPSSIINMKPNDESRMITASLINGSATDKYGFIWSLDAFDVLEMNYSANVCTIKPKKSGTATITISHKKAEFNQQIVVSVSEYSNFSFPMNNITITQGDVKFLNMQVPYSNVKTKIVYESSNPEICTVQGTKDVSQLTGVAEGTATVTAKLNALINNQWIEQAVDEIMVYVKARTVSTAYITSGTTIFTLEQGKSQTLSASITGPDINTADYANLTWTISDSAKRIINITGLNQNNNITGKSIFVTAVGPGEAVIKCSHEKASSDLQFYVVVSGNKAKIVNLNKTYAVVQKGSSGITLSANIGNGENEDYKQLQWTTDRERWTQSSGSTQPESIVRIMGNGKDVTLYPVKVGECVVHCVLPGTESIAKCTVVVEAGKSFSINAASSIKLSPGETRTVEYTINPPDAQVTWLCQQDDTYFTLKDTNIHQNGKGTLEIKATAGKEGSATILATADNGLTGRFSAISAYVTTLSISGAKNFTTTPDKTVTWNYTVYPADAKIVIESSSSVCKITDVRTTGQNTGTITLTPSGESGDNLNFNIYAKLDISGSTPKTYGNTTFAGSIKYNRLTVDVESTTKEKGKYSHYDKDSKTLYLGDGEQCSINLKITDKNFNGYIENVSYSNPDVYLTSERLDNGRLKLTIKHLTDNIKITKMYHITKAWKHKNYTDLSAFKWQVHQYIKFIPFKGNMSFDFLRLIYPGYPGNSDGALPENCYLAYSDGEAGEYDFGGTFRTVEFKKIIVETPVGDPRTGNTTKTEEWSMTFNPDQREPDLEVDTSCANKYLSIDEFENNAWYYCPGTIAQHQCSLAYTNSEVKKGSYALGSFGDGLFVDVKPHVMTSHVQAELVDVKSTDTACSLSDAGKICINVIHNGNRESAVLQIPVKFETRMCPCE